MSEKVASPTAGVLPTDDTPSLLRADPWISNRRGETQAATQAGATPVIKFKAYKYKHKFEIIELNRAIEAGEKTELDDTRWIMGMVTEWNLTDEDTGEPIPAGEFMELSIVQQAQVVAAWQEYSRGLWAEVKKTKDASLSSSSTE